MQDRSAHNKNISNILLAADTNSKENPIQTALQFLKIVRKRWMVLTISFSVILSVFLVKQFTAKEKFYASAELIAITDQFTSSDVLNHPLLKLGSELIVNDEVMEKVASQLSLREPDGLKVIEPDEEVEFLRKNFTVSSTRSKPHVINIRFYDHNKEQAEKCLNAIIQSYQDYSVKSMDEWKEKQLKAQQERIKFYGESDKEVALGSQLLEQAESMTNSLGMLKGEFDSENPQHREQLSHSLQEQIFGIRPDLQSKESDHKNGQIENSQLNGNQEHEKTFDQKENVPAEKNFVEKASGQPGADKVVELDANESDILKKGINPPGRHSINKVVKKMDGFEKELASLQLLLYQSRILNQLRSTVVRIEQKSRNRQNLISELEIPIHVKINKKTETHLLGEPSSINRMAVMVCFLSIGLGVGLIFVMDQFDDHFRSPVEAEKVLIKPVMGIIPAIPDSQRNENVTYDRKEAFFVTKIFMENHGIGQGVTGVTSGSQSENSSDITFELAKIYAQSGIKTLLIDANFRDGKLTETLNHTLGIGLSDLLQQPKTSSEAIKRLVCATDEDNLSFISQGTKSSTPLLLFDQKRLQAILNWAEENYDLVLLDLPSATEFNDAKVIGRYCKHVLFVVSPELTTKIVTRRALVSMESFGCHVAGTIFIDRGKSQVWDSAETPDSPLFNINQMMISSLDSQTRELDSNSDADQNKDSSKSIRIA